MLALLGFVAFLALRLSLFCFLLLGLGARVVALDSCLAGILGITFAVSSAYFISLSGCPLTSLRLLPLFISHYPGQDFGQLALL